MNFVHSFPHSCISLAVTYKKEVQIGIIYNPMLEQLYTAKLSQGAFLNGKPIQVSEQTGNDKFYSNIVYYWIHTVFLDLSQSLVIAEFGTSRDPQKMEVVLKNITALMDKVHGYVVMMFYLINLLWIREM